MNKNSGSTEQRGRNQWGPDPEIPESEALREGMIYQIGNILMVDIARRQRIGLAITRGEIPNSARPSADLGTVRGMATNWMLQHVRDGELDGEVDQDQLPPLLRVHESIMSRLNALKAA